MMKDRYDFHELVGLIAYLRGENGCPWDRVQTRESLKQCLIEETYEVLEAIDASSDAMLEEELGDLLLQVLFLARIAEEDESFDITDVITSICQKLIRRHTHVFGDATADTPEQVMDNWEEIKKKEKARKTHTDTLKSVPANLPALMRSQKVQRKASNIGFDWDNTEDVFKKVREELDELENAYKSQNKDMITEETGDLFFSLVNLSRFLDVQSELALSAATDKFIRRFAHMEASSAKRGKKLDGMSFVEMDELWNQAKEEL